MSSTEFLLLQNQELREQRERLSKMLIIRDAALAVAREGLEQIRIYADNEEVETASKATLAKIREILGEEK